MELKEVFEPIINFIKSFQKKETENSKDKAKERLKLVLYQDRASVSPDYFEMMKKELVEVIKKYVEIDEELMEVELTRLFEDGLDGPALVANIPIKNFKPVVKKVEKKEEKIEVPTQHEEASQEQSKEVVSEESKETANEEEKEISKNSNEQETTENVGGEEAKPQDETEKPVEEKTQEVENKAEDTVKEKETAKKKEPTKKTQSKGRKTTKKQ